MEQITARVLRNAEWKAVYEYKGSSMSFVTYACDALPGLTITHETRGRRKTRTYYSARGRKTDSPTQAVRLYNATIKAAKAERSGQCPPGCPKSAGRPVEPGIDV